MATLPPPRTCQKMHPIPDLWEDGNTTPILDLLENGTSPTPDLSEKVQNELYYGPAGEGTMSFISVLSENSKTNPTTPHKHVQRYYSFTHFCKAASVKCLPPEISPKINPPLDGAQWTDQKAANIYYSSPHYQHRQWMGQAGVRKGRGLVNNSIDN